MNSNSPVGTVTLILIVFLSLTSMLPAQQQPPMFQKSFSPTTITPGSVSTLRFTIANMNPGAAQDMAFTDNLPAGMTVATPSGVMSTCQGMVSAPDGGTAISLTDGRVGAFRSCAVIVQVTADAAGMFDNVSGDLTSSKGNSGSAEATLTVSSDRPSFSKNFDSDKVSLGGRSTLTFTIDNSNNNAGAFNLTFVDNLPPGIVVADPANAFSDCVGGVLSASPGSSTVSYAPVFSGDASVAAITSCSISVGVTGNSVGVSVNTSGDLTSTATSTGFEPRSSGKATAALTVNADRISLSKSFTDDPVAAGDTVTLRFTIRNLNRSSSASNIEFTDDLDATLNGLAALGPLTDPCGPGSALTGSSVLSLTGGNLGPEGSCTFSVQLQVPAGAATGAYNNTTSDISGEVDEEPLTGSPASDLLFVSAAPRLTKSFVNDPVGAGESVELEFTITNTSPNNSATSIGFEDIFDVILPMASNIPPDDFCGMGSTADFIPLIDSPGSGATPASLVVSGASLGPGESCTFSLTLDVVVGAANGFYPNTTGPITATIDGEIVTGRPARDGLVVVSAPRLVKEFIDDPVVAGGTVTLEFELFYEDDAPGDATGITFSDDLTAALPGLTALGLPLTDICGTGSQISGTTNLTFTGGTLQPGESCSFQVTLQTPDNAPTGPHTNTTSSVVATVLGTTAMHNAASDDLRIAGLTLDKEFIDDPARPGGTVTLRFSIENVTAALTATDIQFRDDLDETLAGLTATGLPQDNVCGAGSSLTGDAGNSLLTFQDGILGPGEACSFDVVLNVPVAAEEDTYPNSTDSFSAVMDGQTILFDNAADNLVIVTEFLELTKEFTDDPVGPGETVNLRFTLTNLDGTLMATDIEFTDDLEAALTGLQASNTPQSGVCGTGSMITGTSLLSFSGGSLPPGGLCSFDVTLSVPSSVQLGTTATNTTSGVTGLLEGLAVTGAPASDVLQIDFLTFAKAFDSEATAGGTVDLTFNIQNLDDANTIEELSFQDDLDSVIPGLAAIGPPAADVCGAGSELAGTSLLTLSGGNLLPGGSCTFSVSLQVPGSALPGTYLNSTSDLLQFGFPVARPATAELTILGVADEDGDGVADGDDLCPATVIPESVPTESLGVNRYALVDDDGIFDTTPPNGQGPQEMFTITDTAGCSCEQIIVELGLGQGHVKFGCSLGAMRTWVAQASQTEVFNEIGR